jgi:hypothetical protein
MSNSGRVRLLFVAAIAFAITMPVATARTQGNDLPNPYRTVQNWAKMPEGRTWDH